MLLARSKALKENLILSCCYMHKILNYLLSFYLYPCRLVCFSMPIKKTSFCSRQRLIQRPTPVNMKKLRSMEFSVLNWTSVSHSFPPRHRDYCGKGMETSKQPGLIVLCSKRVDEHQRQCCHIHELIVAVAVTVCIIPVLDQDNENSTMSKRVACEVPLLDEELQAATARGTTVNFCRDAAPKE